MAHCSELRRQLFIRGDYLGEPSSPFEICSRVTISAYLVELRPSFYGFACARNHCLDGGNKTGYGTVFVYALVFVFVETAYVAFEKAALSQASDSDITPRLRRITRIRSYLALGMFSAATIVSYWSPRSGVSSGLLRPAHLPQPARARFAS
jgi:hypothetical protein